MATLALFLFATPVLGATLEFSDQPTSLAAATLQYTPATGGVVVATQDRVLTAIEILSKSESILADQVDRDLLFHNPAFNVVTPAKIFVLRAEEGLEIETDFSNGLPPNLTTDFLLDDLSLDVSAISAIDSFKLHVVPEPSGTLCPLGTGAFIWLFRRKRNQ